MVHSPAAGQRARWGGRGAGERSCPQKHRRCWLPRPSGGGLCSAPAFMAFLGNEVLRVRGPRQRKSTRSEMVRVTIPRCRGLLSVRLLARCPPSGGLLLPVERLCSVVVLGGSWHRWPKFRSGEPVLLRDREVSLTSSLCTLCCGMQDVGRRT